MKFHYKVNAYINYLTSINMNRCNAILDTGASLTVIDLYTLSKLVDKKPDELYKQAESLIERNIVKITYIRTASGHINRVIPIKVYNLTLSDRQFKEFYMHLNIDNTNKNNESDGNILIGLDIIRAGKIHGNKDYIAILDFDYEKYKNNFISTYGNTFSIYEILSVE